MLKKIIMTLMLFSSIFLSSNLFAQPENISKFPSLDNEVKVFNEAGGIDKEFLPSDEAFKHSLWIEGSTLYIGFDIENDYYLYRDKIRILSRDDDYKLSQVEIPEGVEINDEFFGDVFIYEDYAIMSAEIITKEKEISNLPISITFQGCAKAGLCYPPENIIVDVKSFTPPSHLIEAYSAFVSDDNILQDNLMTDETVLNDTTPQEYKTFEKNYFIIVITFFAIGLGLSFTPCVLPMLPILSAIIVGKNRTKKEAFFISSSYSIGVIVVYTVFGLLVGMLGAGLNIRAYLQSPYIVIPVAMLFVLFSLVMFGKVNLSNLLKTNGKLGAKISDTQDKISRTGILGSMVAGMLSVLVLSPCISAPLAGVLLYVSGTGDLVFGAISLASMALGMSVLLIVAGTFGISKLPKSGIWMQYIKNIFGIMLLAMAIWVIGYLLPLNIYHILMSLIGFMIVTQLWKLSSMKNESSLISVLLKTISFIIFMFSFTFTISSIQNIFLESGSQDINANNLIEDKSIFINKDTLKELEETVSEGKYIVYFSADWCVSCRKIERDVFGDKEYISLLSNNEVDVIKIDVTRNTEDNQLILKEFNIFGPPSFLVFEDGVLLETRQGEITIKDAKELIDYK